MTMINETLRNPNKTSSRGTAETIRTSERSSILNHTRAATLSELDQTASQPRKELTKDDLLLAEIRQRQMVNLGQEGWWYPGLLLFPGKDCLCGFGQGEGIHHRSSLFACLLVSYLFSWSLVSTVTNRRN